jgi:cytoskeletal protein CcmA (bactofilin family)
MWNIRQDQPLVVPSVPAPPAPSIQTRESSAHAAQLAGHQSVIGKGLTIKGEIDGAESLESLFIEGTVEGDIRLPGSRVTVGSGGHVAAGIAARSIVICGAVTGNITASERLEIRADGSLIGDACAPRITIETGAFIHGGIVVATKGIEPVKAAPSHPAAPEQHKTIRIRPEAAAAPHMVPSLKTA